jgi:hypothetical protein
MTGVRKLVALAAAAAAVATVPAALGAARDDPTFTVSSSLDGKKVLPLRSHWLGYTSLPPAQVDRVEFLIDGTVRWVERHAPYNYAADDNGKNMGYLITTWLTPGLHRFVVRVYDKAGNSEDEGVTARVVAAPAPPPELARTWTRIESTARGWHSLVWFDRVGMWYTAPFPLAHRHEVTGFVDQYDVRGHTLDVYGSVVMGVREIEKGVCKGNGCLQVTHAGQHYEIDGNVCNFSGPFGSYRWSVSGDTLTLRVIHEGCFGRGKGLAGTWTRAG